MAVIPAPPRRRFQFRLTDLFCVTLLVAIWAWGMEIIGCFHEPILGWVQYTATCAIGIWIFIRAAVRHQQRASGKEKSGEPPETQP